MNRHMWCVVNPAKPRPGAPGTAGGVNVATTEPILARVATAAWNQDTLIVSKFLRPQVQVEALPVPETAASAPAGKAIAMPHAVSSLTKVTASTPTPHSITSISSRGVLGPLVYLSFSLGSSLQIDWRAPFLHSWTRPGPAHDGVPHDAWVRGEGLRGPRLPQILLPVLRRQDACDQTD